MQIIGTSFSLLEEGVINTEGINPVALDWNQKYQYKHCFQWTDKDVHERV